MVVDGGSADQTVAAARAGGASVLRSRPGRARQLNAGAEFLSSPWLLFLHADSRLDDRALRAVEAHVRSGLPGAAHFGLTFSHPHFFYRLVEGGQRVRERLFGLVYGDQGLLLRRDFFFREGPYPDEPVMEDVILNLRLRKAGPVRRLPANILSSARRYEEEGRIRAWVRNARLISRFMASTRPAALAAHYRPRRRRSPSGACAADGAGTASDAASAADTAGSTPAAALLVFAKVPRPGAVKTRLARTLGDAAAAAAYRRMGRLIVDQLADAPARMIVCFDPPDAEADMRRWLGPAPAAYIPQGQGTLGERISRMFEAAFARGERAVVVGTDALSVDSATIARALDALETADVVLGPSRDGGYYLMGLRKHRPELFRSIPWSTSAVFERTRARARQLGLRVTYLETQSDIDTADDLTPEVARQLGVAL